MNNFFGLGILIELRDRASNALNRLSSSLSSTERQASDLNESVNNLGASVGNMGQSTSDLNGAFSSTTSYTRNMERQMQRLAHMMGGEVPESVRSAYGEMFRLRAEVQRAKRTYGAYSAEVLQARDNLNGWALGLDDATFKQVFMRSQLGLTDHQLKQQANSMKLNARMTKLMGNQTDILINRMKGLQRHGVKPEMLIPPSTPGAFDILNRAIDSSRSKIYRLTSAQRKLGASMEKVIKKYSAMKVAVKQANGDMAKHALLMQQATAGMMNLGIIAPIMLGGVAMFYGGLMKVAFGTNEKLQELAETVKGKVMKALKPLLDLVGDIAEAVLNMVGKVADWIAKFNEAHPVIAKVVSAIMLLVPALTLLALPIGFLPFGITSIMSALEALMKFIGGFVAGLTTASAVALACAGIFVILGASITKLWKTNKEFRDNMTQTWNSIKTVVKSAVTHIQEVITKFCTIVKKHWSNLGTHLKDTMNSVWGLITSVAKIGLDVLGTIFGVSTSDLHETWESAWGKILSTTDKILGTLVEKLAEKLNTITTVVKGVTDKINKWWAEHGETIKTNVVKAYEKVKEVIRGVLDTIKGVIKDGLDQIRVFWNKHGYEITNTYYTLAPVVKEVFNNIKNLCKTVIDTMTKFWEENGDTVKSIMSTIFDVVSGVINNIAPIISSVLGSITSFISKHGDTIATIIRVAWWFIETTIVGILENIKGVVEGVLGAIDGIINFFSALFEGDFSGMWESIKQVFWDSLKAIANGIMLYLNVGVIKSFKGLWTSAKGLVKGMWTSLKEAFGMGVINCKIWVDDLVKAVIKFFTTDMPIHVQNGVNTFWSWVSNAFSTACTFIKGVVRTFIDEVILFFQNLFSNGVSIFDSMWTFIKNLWNSGVTALKGFIDDLVIRVKDKLSEMVTNAKTFFTDFLEAGKEKFSDLLTNIGEKMAEVPEKVKKFINDAIDFLKSISLADIGRDMIQGLIDGIVNMGSNVVGAIKDVVSGAVQKARDFLGIKSPSRVFKKIGAWTSEGMALGIEKDAPKVIHAVEDMSEKTVDSTDSLVKHQYSMDNMSKLSPMPSKAQAKSTSSNQPISKVENTFNFTINSDNMSNPKGFVDEVMREIERRTQLKNTLAYNR